MPGVRYKVYQVQDNNLSPSQKMWLFLSPGEKTLGASTIVARDTGTFSVTGLGFQPDVVIFLHCRPKFFDGTTDSTFGARAGYFSYGAMSATAQFAGAINIRQAFDGPDYCLWREDRCLLTIRHSAIFEAEFASMDADGFTINILTNLYDADTPLAFLALKGTFKIGVFTAGDTNVSTGFEPEGVWFTSTKSRLSDHVDGALRVGWDLMNGFAAVRGTDSALQQNMWGGTRGTTSWGWSTSRWDTARALSLHDPASSSFFVGATPTARATVSAWNASSFDLTWSENIGQPYRIGYLAAATAETASVMEWYDSRPPPSGTGNDGEIITTINPMALIGTTTGYYLSHPAPIESDAYLFGGHGYLSLGADPWGLTPTQDEVMIHCAQGSVQERGHYQNSLGSCPTDFTKELGGVFHTSNTMGFQRHHIDIYESIPHRTQDIRIKKLFPTREP